MGPIERLRPVSCPTERLLTFLGPPYLDRAAASVDRVDPPNGVGGFVSREPLDGPPNEVGGSLSGEPLDGPEVDRRSS